MISDAFSGTLDEAIEATDGKFGITCFNYEAAKLFLGYIRDKGYPCEALALTDEELRQEFSGYIKAFKRVGNVITYGTPVSSDCFIGIERGDFK